MRGVSANDGDDDAHEHLASDGPTHVVSAASDEGTHGTSDDGEDARPVQVEATVPLDGDKMATVEGVKDLDAVAKDAMSKPEVKGAEAADSSDDAMLAAMALGRNGAKAGSAASKMAGNAKASNGAHRGIEGRQKQSTSTRQSTSKAKAAHAPSAREAFEERRRSMSGADMSRTSEMGRKTTASQTRVTRARHASTGTTGGSFESPAQSERRSKVDAASRQTSARDADMQASKVHSHRRDVSAIPRTKGGTIV